MYIHNDINHCAERKKGVEVSYEIVKFFLI